MEWIGFDKHYKLQDWLPDVGINFECASFASVVSDGELRECVSFVSMRLLHVSDYLLQLLFGAEHVSSPRGSLYINLCTFWLIGKLVNDGKGKPTFQIYNR